MEKRNWKHSVTLKQRMVLCLAAFFAAFALQLALNGYQARAVQQVQDDQMGNFNAISRFQGGVESSISILEAYRWENGETEEMLEKLQAACSTSNAWLWRIRSNMDGLQNVSDEQWVLYGAVETTYGSYNTLLEEGEKAMLAAEQHVVTPALERVIEANTYLSGVGFESGGLAAAHAVHNGLTAIPDAHHYYHGEKVAFGTLTQLVLENAPVEEIETVAALSHAVGLPITLAQLDIKEDVPAKMRIVAEAACAEGETIHNMPGGATPDQVYAALLVADQYGQRFLQEWE